MAAIALQRRVNINTRAIRNPSSFLHLFSSWSSSSSCSSSSSTSDHNVQDQNQNTRHSSSSSPSPSPSSHYRQRFTVNEGVTYRIGHLSDMLKQMRLVEEDKTKLGQGAMPLSRDTESFKSRPLDPNQRESPMVIRRGGENLPLSKFDNDKHCRDSIQKSQMSSDQDKAMKSVSPMANLQETMETRSRVAWLPSYDAYLVELFIEHYNGGGNTQSGFESDVYRKVTQAINNKFSMNLVVPQIKSRYNVLKKEFGIVKALLKVSGFLWDDTLKMVVADDKQWEDYLVVHGDAKAFRRKRFPLYDRLSILFEGQCATGKYQVSSIQVASEEENSNANTSQVSKSTHPSTKEVFATQEGSSSSSDLIFQLESGKPKKLKVDHAITSSSRRKPPLKTGDKIANAFFEMASTSNIKAELKMEANGFLKYEKCIEDLQKMEELSEAEILKSLSALRDEKNAIAFLTLKGPLRLAFLRSLW